VLLSTETRRFCPDLLKNPETASQTDPKREMNISILFKASVLFMLGILSFATGFQNNQLGDLSHGVKKVCAINWNHR
jgi:hypothetical protein